MYNSNIHKANANIKGFKTTMYCVGRKNVIIADFGQPHLCECMHVGQVSTIIIELCSLCDYSLFEG
jgi:hypothetical protein